MRHTKTMSKTKELEIHQARMLLRGVEKKRKMARCFQYKSPPAEMITYTHVFLLHLLLSVARSAIMHITMPGFFLHPPQLIEVMQMHVYRHFQCSDFIHVDECVQNEKKQVGRV